MVGTVSNLLFGSIRRGPASPGTWSFDPAPPRLERSRV